MLLEATLRRERRRRRERRGEGREGKAVESRGAERDAERVGDVSTPQKGG